LIQNATSLRFLYAQPLAVGNSDWAAGLGAVPADPGDAAWSLADATAIVGGGGGDDDSDGSVLVEQAALEVLQAHEAQQRAENRNAETRQAAESAP